MLRDLDRLAARALLGEEDPEASSADVDAETLRLWQLLARGAYGAVLDSPLAVELLGSLLDADTSATAGGADGAAAASVRAKAYLCANATPTAAATVTWIGAAALCRFVERNWTSTAATPGASVEVAGEAGAAVAAAKEHALAALSVDGETAYVLLSSPELLLAARAMLLEPLAELTAAASSTAASGAEEAAPASGLVASSACWWAARAATVHEWCLTGVALAPSLELVISKCMRAATDGLAASAAVTDGLCGASVMVINLGAKPELNGMLGTAGRFDAQRGRYSFKPQGGGEGLWLKPDNLLKVANEAEPR